MLEKKTVLDKCEVVNMDTLPSIQCRHKTFVQDTETGEIIGGSQYHRHVIASDSDLKYRLWHQLSSLKQLKMLMQRRWQRTMLSNIPTDKQLHFFSGGMLAGLLMPFSVQMAVFGVVFAGIGKELYDLLSEKGTPEIEDAVATILGGSVVVLVHTILG
jgi:hypothetical protein